MELNAEINRVFGQEMAKLFADQIDEKQMLAEAEIAWRELREEKWNYGTYGSEFKNLIASALKQEMMNEITTITSSEQFKTECKELAKQMVDEIRDETHQKIVDEVSSRLCGYSVGGYGVGIKGLIEETVLEMIRK